MRSLNFVSVGVFMLSCVGCAATARESASPAASSTANPPSVARTEPDARIAIADDILEACGIKQSDAYFEYNSTALRTREAGIVSQLADCFSNGPLAGRGMKLVGHADPRGDEEYNFVLAGRRADSVRQGLADHQLDPVRVSTTSRGELDASGRDESGWSKDRRVDVLLAN
jgi:peptidoglycan-associated lipoprotein